MKIHKEGYSIISYMAVTFTLIVLTAALLFPSVVVWIVGVILFLMLLFVTSFFRSPARKLREESDTVYSPADGTIVVIEEVEENEYFQERRLLVSVFMSIWNVHVNWFPVAGKVDYFRHHHGRFLVAWHPKSSEDNERTTTVVEMPSGAKVLFRQIAGLVARRIVSYARMGVNVGQNTQCGFIKFGSRIDLYLPLDAEVLVNLGDKVVGTQTPLAKLK